MRCRINIQDRECSTATVENGNGTRISPPAWGFAFTGKRHIVTYRAQYLISPCLRRRGGSCSRYLGRVAGCRHNDRLLADDKLLEAPRETLPTTLRPPRSSRGRRRKPHPEYELTNTHVLQPYCNRASTHWYAMDKTIALDHPTPPKNAQFPDTVGRARTYASKLVAGAYG